MSWFKRARKPRPPMKPYFILNPDGSTTRYASDIEVANGMARVVTIPAPLSEPPPPPPPSGHTCCCRK